MKKLMIAAFAAASVGSVVAGNCTPVGPTPVEKTPEVYTWKFSGKTTAADYIKGYNVPGTTGCAPTSGVIVDGEAIRVPGSLAIQGYTYYCVPCCDTLTTDPDLETFYISKPAKDKLDGGVATQFANVIGKKANQVEIYGMFTAKTGPATSSESYELAYAGFGKYDKKYVRVTSASGNFSGYKVVPHYMKITGCPEAVYWDCTGSVYLSGNPAIAYGKWSVKYNSSASKKYAKGLLVKLPSWAR